MVFTGGPSVGGEGAVVGPDLTEQLRGHTDILTHNKGSQRRKAVDFYEKLSKRAAAGGYAVDIVTASLEETGLHEMRSCVQRSGGVALQAETFGADHLRQSLERLFVGSEAAAGGGSGGDEELRIGYKGTLELKASIECEGAELLGGAAEGDESVHGEVIEAGETRSFTWTVGALTSHHTAALSLKRSGEELHGPRDAAYFQLSATYRTATGGKRTRVSTFRMPRVHNPTPPIQLLPAFDQQAAAAMLVRRCVSQAEGGAPPAEMLTSIDRALIKVMRALCDYRKGDPASVVLPPHAAQLPGLVFHLRRSPVVRTAGVSPDKTAYFRQLAASLSVFSTLVLVQPTLVGYERQQPPRPIMLDPAAMAPDRSLLLDTFLQVLLCHGANIAHATKSGGGDPAVQKLNDDAQRDLQQAGATRFPAPELFECEQHGSKARYVVQKLNPDVTLTTFLQGLYKAIVGAK